MIAPFADDDSASSIAGLSAENGTARILLSGSIEITRDNAGLAKARELKRLADGIVEALETGGPLRESEAGKTATVEKVANPFA